MIFIPKKVSFITLIGISGELSIVILQFLGTSYFLIGCFLYIAKNLKGSPLINIMIALNLMGLLHFFLIFKSNTLISLPIIYFVFQMLTQILLIICLIDTVKKNR
jgi:hypothetical protein